jgi:hypothetical protein
VVAGWMLGPCIELFGDSDYVQLPTKHVQPSRTDPDRVLAKTVFMLWHSTIQHPTNYAARADVSALCG